MSVRDCIEEIEKILDEGFSFPGSRKVMVDGENVRRLLKEIDEYLPTDIHQAQNIVRDRGEIIDAAKQEAEKIIKDAEKRRAALVSESEITRQSQKQANELVQETNRKCAEIRKAANEYVNDLMKRTDDSLVASLTELRTASQSLKESQKSYEKSLAEKNNEQNKLNASKEKVAKEKTDKQ